VVQQQGQSHFGFATFKGKGKARSSDQRLDMPRTLTRERAEADFNWAHGNPFIDGAASCPATAQVDQVQDKAVSLSVQAAVD
jgi:hypothetical protein